MEHVLQTNALSKKYKGVYAVNKVNINVRKGDIYGLIGKNGAGKTTLMRMVTGLAMPDEGEMQLFGSTNLNKALPRTGCVIENPALYPNMTAEQNMEYYRTIYGIVEKEPIHKILKLVGLTDTGKKKTKHFSLGMKQRLSIAIALLGNPDFLVLDEPTNGLDPQGIKEMRNLFINLKEEQGITILISSHILGELSKFATSYGIIHEGCLIEEFTTEELDKRCRRCLKIQVEDTKKATFVLEKEMDIHEYDVPEDGTIRVFERLEESSKVNQILAKSDVMVKSISTVGEDLEGYFMERMGEK